MGAASESIYPAQGVFQPVQSDTADLVDDNGDPVIARNVWATTAGTVAFVCVDGSSGSWTFAAAGALPEKVAIRQIKDTGTTLNNNQMVCTR